MWEKWALILIQILAFYLKNILSTGTCVVHQETVYSKCKKVNQHMHGHRVGQTLNGVEEGE